MPVSLLTDWVAIARSGATVDGRMIEPDWIRQMAESYDPELYTAVLNVEHYYGNLGTVREVRAVEKENFVELQARICPNKYYLNRINESTGVFFSVEIHHDFCGSGKCYLVGLASTDTPASTGTTEVHFSRKSSEECVWSSSFSGELPVVASSKEPGLVNLVRQAVAEFFQTKPTPKKDDEMDAKEFSTLIGDALKPLAEKLSAIEQHNEQAPEKFLESTEGKEFKSNFESFQKDFKALSERFESYAAKLDEALKDQNHDNQNTETGDNADLENII